MSNGITETSIQELLDLSDADMRFIDLKVILKNAVKEYRQKSKITQQALAELIDSSQSRVAKLEGGDPSVSIDMMLNCLFYMGVNNFQLAAIICPDRVTGLIKVDMASLKQNAEPVACPPVPDSYLKMESATATSLCC